MVKNTTHRDSQDTQEGWYMGLPGLPDINYVTKTFNDIPAALGNLPGNVTSTLNNLPANATETLGNLTKNVNSTLGNVNSTIGNLTENVNSMMFGNTSNDSSNKHHDDDADDQCDKSAMKQQLLHYIADIRKLRGELRDDNVDDLLDEATVEKETCSSLKPLLVQYANKAFIEQHKVDNKDTHRHTKKRATSEQVEAEESTTTTAAAPKKKKSWISRTKKFFSSRLPRRLSSKKRKSTNTNTILGRMKKGVTKKAKKFFGWRRKTSKSTTDDTTFDYPRRENENETFDYINNPDNRSPHSPTKNETNKSLDPEYYIQDTRLKNDMIKIVNAAAFTDNKEFFFMDLVHILCEKEAAGKKIDALVENIAPHAQMLIKLMFGSNSNDNFMQLFAAYDDKLSGYNEYPACSNPRYIEIDSMSKYYLYYNGLKVETLTGFIMQSKKVLDDLISFDKKHNGNLFAHALAKNKHFVSEIKKNSKNDKSFIAVANACGNGVIKALLEDVIELAAADQKAGGRGRGRSRGRGRNNKNHKLTKKKKLVCGRCRSRQCRCYSRRRR